MRAIYTSEKYSSFKHVDSIIMNFEEAKELLSYHSGYNSDTGNSKWKQGFLGQLRPYTGRLYESNFLELVDVLEVFQKHYRSENIDKEAMAMLFDVCTVPRLWAFDPEGMLRRNKLIRDEELSVLNDWLIRLSEGVSYLLNDAKVDMNDVMIGYGETRRPYLSVSWHSIYRNG